MRLVTVKIDHYPIFYMPKVYHICGLRKSGGLNELINQTKCKTCSSPTHMAYWKFQDTKKHKTSSKRYLTYSFLKELHEKGLLLKYKCILNLDQQNEQSLIYNSAYNILVNIMLAWRKF